MPRLSVMMFLQFFIWGSWYVTAGTYVPAMKWPQATTGWVYTAGPIAALISPLLLGLIVDRFFASQWVLAAMHLLGGILMLMIPSAGQESFDLWIFQKEKAAKDLEFTQQGYLFGEPASATSITKTLVQIMSSAPEVFNAYDDVGMPETNIIYVPLD